MRLLLLSVQSNAYLTGLKYLAANAKACGHEAKILHLPGYFESALDPAVEAFIKEFDPHLIGISLMSIEYYPTINLTRLLKAKFSAPVIWGGVHAVIKPEDCLKHSDYICCGEGERAIVSLLEHLRDKGRDIPPSIPNIWANHKGDYIKTQPSMPESDLDSFPMQEYLPKYFYVLHKGKIYNYSENPRIFRKHALYGGTCHMMITTRGCPFNCGYCANSYLSKVYGRKIRKRSVDNCMAELKEVKKDPYVLYINFEDDCFFSHSREWISEFCKEYKKHIDLPFMVRAIPTLLDREKLSMLDKADLSWIIMGVQSGSDRVNHEIYRREIKFESVRKAAEMLTEFRVVPYYEMITDNPYETERDSMETIKAMASLKKFYTISLSHLTFFPGTPLTERALSEGIADPDAYLHRYMVDINKTYYNKLLSMTPYIPRSIVKFLNKPEASRTAKHTLLLKCLHFTVKRTIEPAIYLYLIMRSLNYNIIWTLRTVQGNWRSAMSKFISNYLGKNDLKYGMKLTSFKEKELGKL
ncbi:MAG: B12-binding domain-containing radical SAM protein [Nitrospirae bacterium]|nr:B12-binding domain-containing radical SAM protein [Nitrospirota bacterium]